jgi:hypothetical protein
MSEWNNWYNSFLETKRNKELEAFAAGLRGEKFSPPAFKPRYDSTSSWSELVSIAQNNLPDLGSIDFDYKEGSIESKNPLILVCVEKALKNNANYGLNRILNYLIFNYLKNYSINDVASFIKVIREIPDEIFLECNNCGNRNEPGWASCSKCQVDIDTSFDD